MWKMMVSELVQISFLVLTMLDALYGGHRVHSGVRYDDAEIVVALMVGRWSLHAW